MSRSGYLAFVPGRDRVPSIMKRKIVIVVPCYNVRRFILEVLESVGPEVSKIFVVDDAWPEQTGIYVEEHCSDTRVTVLYNEINVGVGASVIRGFKAGIAIGAEILVKVDGDGQIDPGLVRHLVAPIEAGLADYVKGNRFYSISDSRAMPIMRRLGNIALSFITKFAPGYHQIFDPTNGFIAIHAGVAHLLPFDKISTRCLFESDLPFQLGCLRAVVQDVPMCARYGDETSNLKISRIAFECLVKNVRNFIRRIFLGYFLRDFSYGSAQIICGIPLFAFGIIFGVTQWELHHARGEYASAGTVMLSALPFLIGLQLLLGFIKYDLENVPRVPLHRSLPGFILRSGDAQ